MVAAFDLKRWVQGGRIPRIGFIAIFVGTFVFFSISQPDLFPNLENFRFMFRQAAIGSIVALGLTLVLTAREFDLAGVGIIGLSAGISIQFIVESGVAWPLAVVLALLGSILFGVFSGVAVAYVGLSSIVSTLAIGSLCHAAEYWITDRKQITGAPEGFTNLGRGDFGPLEIPVVVALVFVALTWVGLERSEFGRRLRAVGENPSASRLVGVRVARIKVIVFALAGFAAGVTGILVGANAGAYDPDLGAGYFIPSYAAVFLGGAVGRQGRFTVGGTVMGLIFLAMIRNGFQLMSIDAWLADVVSGLIIVIGAILSRVGMGSEGTALARH